MAFKRCDAIVQRIRYQMKIAKMEVPNPAVILDAMDQAQKDMCQRGLALKHEMEIYLEKDVDLYDLGVKIFQPDSFIYPPAWRSFPDWCYRDGKYDIEVITDLQRWNIINTKVLPSTSHPIAVMVWNERLRFYPSPKVTGEKLYAWLYLNPSQPLQLGNDPDVNENWDTCLQFGGLRYLSVPTFNDQYESELSRMGFQQSKEIIGGVHKMENFTDGIGF
jgi:hypothetical protein